jgi:hypothetical protein
MNSSDIENIKAEFLKQNIRAKNFNIDTLPSDASMRVYERITHSDTTVMLMNASKELHSVEPFIKINELLESKGYSVPHIIAKDVKHGLLLLEDFGNNTYTKLLEDTKETKFEHDLYKKAVNVLIKLHKEKIDVPLHNHDQNLLIKEVSLLIDWYFPTLNDSPLSDELRSEFLSIWKNILSNINYDSSCLVLRDYHVDNIMLLDERIGVQSVGLLDFQDAVSGSYAYDLVSLLEDARRNLPKKLVSDMMHHYLDNMPNIDKQKFLMDYAILGVQRSCKVVGIFSRKSVRDQDNKYLIHLPRLWDYIRQGINTPIMKPLKEWFSKIDAPIIRDRPNVD